jgi:hypothetical protein
LAVIARSTSSSTAPSQPARAAFIAAAEVAVMAVSTGFTPMRSKCAWYAGMAS